LSSPRAYFNLDWITLVVMIIVAIVGAVFFLISRSGRDIGDHLHDPVEASAAERS
jgi:hypothetical protein